MRFGGGLGEGGGDEGGFGGGVGVAVVAVGGEEALLERLVLQGYVGVGDEVVAEEDFGVVAEAMDVDVKYFLGIALWGVAFVEA